VKADGKQSREDRTINTLHSFSSNPPLSISQQEVCIKANAISWNQRKLVEHIKMTSHF
jgi:hypothetical protein